MQDTAFPPNEASLGELGVFKLGSIDKSSIEWWGPPACRGTPASLARDLTLTVYPQGARL
jgi:hypothetical protein